MTYYLELHRLWQSSSSLAASATALAGESRFRAYRIFPSRNCKSTMAQWRWRKLKRLMLSDYNCIPTLIEILLSLKSYISASVLGLHPANPQMVVNLSSLILFMLNPPLLPILNLFARSTWAGESKPFIHLKTGCSSVPIRQCIFSVCKILHSLTKYLSSNTRVHVIL